MAIRSGGFPVPAFPDIQAEPVLRCAPAPLNSTASILPITARRFLSRVATHSAAAMSPQRLLNLLCILPLDSILLRGPRNLPSRTLSSGRACRSPASEGDERD